MAEYKGVIIFGEVTNGKLASITAELLGCGRNFADELKEDSCCLLVSDEIGETAPSRLFGFMSKLVFQINFTLWGILCPVC